VADQRTKRQKVQELYDKASTPGEKAAAQAALDRMAAEPASRGPRTARTTTRSYNTNRVHVSWTDYIDWGDDEWSTGETVFTWDGQWKPPTGGDAHPAGRQSNTREHMERMQAEFDQLAEEMGARVRRVNPKLYGEYAAGKISWTEFISRAQEGRHGSRTQGR
jgi:hypothetical protein